MPYNGSGSFTPPGADFPAVANTLIQSSKFNNVINDIATGLSTCITTDGQSTITANIPLGGNRITGLGSAVAKTDAANAGDVQNGGFMWGGTAGGTANALTLTLTPVITAYAAGQRFVFKSGASANTAAVTVAVSGLATKAVQIQGVALSGAEIQASQWYAITYDGTAFQLEDAAFYKQKLVISKNTAAPPAVIGLPDDSDLLHIVGKDAADTGIILDTFGTAVNPRLYGRRARGTNASKTAVQDGDNLLVVEVQGYDGSAYTTDYDGLIRFIADGNWTGSSHGVKIAFEVTPSGSIVPQTAGFATYRGFEAYVSGDSALGNFVRNVSTGSSAYSVTYYGDVDSETAAIVGIVCKNNSAYGGAKSMLLGTNTNVPVVVVVNGAEAGRFDSTGYLGRMNSYNAGTWTAPAFSAGDFTANGSMTWTVAAGDVGTYAYTIVNKTMTVAFTINTSTVGGTLDTQLSIAIPASKVATKSVYQPIVLLDNGSRVMGFALVNATGTVITINRLDGGNFSAATDTTYVLGQITFEID